MLHEYGILQKLAVFNHQWVFEISVVAVFKQPQVFFQNVTGGILHVQ